MRRWISSIAPVLVLMLPAPGLAQESEGEVLVAYAYNLRHRGAADALNLVIPLLSKRGAVELQPGENALVVRDTARALDVIRPRLQAFDHAFEPLRLRVQIIKAERASVGGGTRPDFPEGVLTRLRELLKYESYSLLAGSELSIEDGMAVVQDLGATYRVDFRLKHTLTDERASLEGFRLSRESGNEFVPLIHANLNLDLDKPMVLGLAPSEASDAALMLVIENLPIRTAAKVGED